MHEGFGVRCNFQVENTNVWVLQDEVMVGLRSDLDFGCGWRGQDGGGQQEEGAELHGGDCSIAWQDGFRRQRIPERGLEGEAGLFVEPTVFVADYEAVGPCRHGLKEKPGTGWVSCYCFFGDTELQLGGVGAAGLKASKQGRTLDADWRVLVAASIDQ